MSKCFYAADTANSGGEALKRAVIATVTRKVTFVGLMQLNTDVVL